jgi:hypothetical protein
MGIDGLPSFHELHLDKKAGRSLLPSPILFCTAQYQAFLGAGDRDKAIAPFFFHLCALVAFLENIVGNQHEPE